MERWINQFIAEVYPSAERPPLSLTVKFFVILTCRLLQGDTHMIKLRNFWSEYGSDTLIASIVMMVVFGIFLLIAYLLIKTF